MGRTLENRICKLTVGNPGRPGKSWIGGNEGLRIKFNIKKVPTKSTNKASIDVYNLNPDSRQFIQKGMKVALSGGYEKTQQGLFFGDIQRVKRPQTPKAGDELKITIEAGDGIKALQNATIQKSFGPNASAENIASSLADSMGANGVTEGFKAAIDDIPGLKNGFSASGKTSSELDALFAGTEYDWSLQDEQLEIVGESQVAETGVVALDYESGLLEAKQLEDGRIETTSFLMGRIKPNRRIKVNSKRASGVFRSLEVEHNGDTHGDNWNTIAVIE